MGGCAAVMLAATMTSAAGAWTDVGDWFGDRFYYNPGEGALFSPYELSLDLFGSVYDNDRHTFSGERAKGQFGGGLGTSYFLTRELGLSLDTTISDNGSSFFDSLVGSVIYRYPLEELRIAPYAFAGLGGQFDVRDELSGHLGIGLEYRLNPLAGVFVDTRYVFTEETKDFWQFRGGMRFIF